MGQCKGNVRLGTSIEGGGVLMIGAVCEMGGERGFVVGVGHESIWGTVSETSGWIVRVWAWGGTK